MNLETGILVLAAGSSSRMGSIKQLLPWADSNILSHVVHTAMDTMAERVLVVTGANAAKIQNNLNETGALLVENKQWATGIGSSIVCGLKTLLSVAPKTAAVLILLADQPLIDTGYLNQLIATYNQSGSGIVATKYPSGPGVPAIFDKSYFSALINLNQDAGARMVLKNNLNDVFLLDPEGREMDIDTPEDYIKLTREDHKGDR